MIKLFIAAGIPATLLIFGLKDAALYTGVIAFFVLFFSWIIKGNKQQPGESDEVYSKRMKKLKEAAQVNSLPENKSKVDDPMLDPTYSMAPGNVYHSTTFSKQ